MLGCWGLAESEMNFGGTDDMQKQCFYVIAGKKESSRMLFILPVTF